jgi:hypothetical protein
MAPAEIGSGGDQRENLGFVEIEGQRFPAVEMNTTGGPVGAIWQNVFA